MTTNALRDRAWLAAILSLSVAFGAVLAVGKAVMRGRNHPPGLGAAPQAAPQASSELAWTLEELSVESICRDGGSEYVQGLLKHRTGKAPYRLVDHIPDSSPLTKFRTAYDGPADQVSFTIVDKVLTSHQPAKGWARTFNTAPGGGPGGFTVYAFEFADEVVAEGAAVEMFVALVCDGGANPKTVVQEPGILVGVRTGSGADTYSWWVHGNRLIAVGHGMWSGTDIHDVPVALKATWDAGS